MEAKAAAPAGNSSAGAPRLGWASKARGAGAAAACPPSNMQGSCEINELYGKSGEGLTKLARLAKIHSPRCSRGVNGKLVHSHMVAPVCSTPLLLRN